jgi:hypothetical protein
MDDTKIDRHESFGMVGFNRISSSGPINLFGSSVQSQTAVTLTIQTASRRRDLSRDWIHADKELIQVMLSPNQFSDLLTSMNVGGGVPCTIQHINGKRMEECPAVDQRKQFVDDFTAVISRIMEAGDALVKDVADILDNKASIGKGDREKIKKQVEGLVQHVRGSVPFVHSQFNKAMDKTVTQARAEVDCFVENKVRSLGLNALDNEVAKAIAAPSKSPVLQIENKSNT